MAHLVQPVMTFGKVLAGTGEVTHQSVAGSPRIPDEAAVASSIVQAMRLQWRDGVGTAVVNLKPDYLGAVSIALRIEGGAVTATLHAEDPHVRAWIEENEPLLRQGLSQQGLSLDRLVVSRDRPADEGGQPDGRRPREEDEPRPRTPRRQQGGAFEIVV